MILLVPPSLSDSGVLTASKATASGPASYLQVQNLGFVWDAGAVSVGEVLYVTADLGADTALRFWDTVAMLYATSDSKVQVDVVSDTSPFDGAGPGGRSGSETTWYDGDFMRGSEEPEEYGLDRMQFVFTKTPVSDHRYVQLGITMGNPAPSTFEAARLVIGRRVTLPYPGDQLSGSVTPTVVETPDVVEMGSGFEFVGSRRKLVQVQPQLVARTEDDHVRNYLKLQAMVGQSGDLLYSLDPDSDNVQIVTFMGRMISVSDNVLPNDPVWLTSFRIQGAL